MAKLGPMEQPDPVAALCERAQVKKHYHARACAEDDDWTCWSVSYNKVEICVVGEDRRGEFTVVKGIYDDRRVSAKVYKVLDDAINDGIRNFVERLLKERADINDKLRKLGIDP